MLHVILFCFLFRLLFIALRDVCVSVRLTHWHLACCCAGWHAERYRNGKTFRLFSHLFSPRICQICATFSWNTPRTETKKHTAQAHTHKHTKSETHLMNIVFALHRLLMATTRPHKQEQKNKNQTGNSRAKDDEKTESINFHGCRVSYCTRRDRRAQEIEGERERVCEQ